MVRSEGDHLGFTLSLSEVHNGIFIPKYYNPEITADLEALNRTHELIELGDLIAAGHITCSTGDEIGKMAYGTGAIPFIRTSDISNWEIKTDPKQGVSESIYDDYAAKQDVQSGDIFFVRDGTYLIGQSCLITDHDLPCLYQSHIIKLRVGEGSPLSSHLLLACLNTAIVKRQIRAKQFTADIIDTIGHRLAELILPVPKDSELRNRVTEGVRDLTTERIRLREHIKKLPFLAQGLLPKLESPLSQELQRADEAIGNAGFRVRLSNIKNGVFMPKYYDPALDADIESLAKTHNLISLSDLVQDGSVSWKTGIEVGKMAYGTGPIPFIRTSDITNWELKTDPKQCVSPNIYAANRQDVRAEDIFVVRDGTYLVGTSCILTEHDTKLLYCGGLYKLRVERPERIDPYMLLVLLNTPIVRRQMRSKQFTRDIIDTLGKRLFEVVLPVPKKRELLTLIKERARELIQERVQLRTQARQITLDVEAR